MLKSPPMQTATATIDTLCGRLQSATLLEDRRAAILGLRSFAKQYPASVASGSLRELITTLRRDGLGNSVGPPNSKDGEQIGEGGDIDTIRLVLETLIMLFNPDSNSPEAGDEIAYFMADEFAMRQDNVILLLSLLDPTSAYADYYSRLYSVQLLSTICAARPERLQECILGAPLGVSRLVGILDDGRDAVRNAGLLLLIDLTGGANEELRKIVAFEDVFGKAFALISMEGSLADAGIAAQDCLSLMANIVQGSGSNQTMFRESGCVKQLVQLLQQVFPPTTQESTYLAEARGKGGWGVLQLLKLFLVQGETSTPPNQLAFFRAGAAQILADLGFHAELPIPVRISALETAAALIRDNSPLQETFAGLQISIVSPTEQQTRSTLQSNGSKSRETSARNSARTSAEKTQTYVIEALLDLTLSQSRTELTLRAAGCSLLQAYLAGHARIKAHFLQRAIAGHTEGESAANVLTTLLHADTDPTSVNYASSILQDLVGDLADAKRALLMVREGDESEGEDVVSAVQAFGSQLQSALQPGGDDRLVSPYCCLLSLLLWEFSDGIDDLLAEGSGLLQAVVDAIKQVSTSPTTAGLLATLLGIIFEFSTKDSPIPRRTLAPLLVEKLGRAKYLDALLQFRRHPLIRDFGLDSEDEPIQLNSGFVDLFMNEYSRLRRAIDKDPGIEVLPSSAIEAGVDRDILDQLRGQLQTAKDALAQAQQEAVAHGQKSEQDHLALQKELQTAAAEVERLRKINRAVQQSHDEEVQKLQLQQRKTLEGINVDHSRTLAGVRLQADQQIRSTRDQKDAEFRDTAQGYERRIAELGNAHRSEQAAHAGARRNLETLMQQHTAIVTREQQAAQGLRDVNSKHADLQLTHQTLQLQADRSSSELISIQASMQQREEELASAQARIAALEEELTGKEEELKTERAGFAELEQELDAARVAASAAANTNDDTTKSAIAKSEKLEQLSKNLAAEVKKLKSESEDLHKQLDNAKGTNEAVTRAERAAEEAKEGEKSAGEELESMLLVLGEIEGKRDEYKDKVKELGGEVSEDEDEDDDDDEEEADEEEDGEVD